MLSGVWQLAKLSVLRWIEDRSASRGAAIAYYTIFSLAPLLLLVVALAGLAFGREAAEGAILGQLTALVGQRSALVLESMLASADDIGSGLLAGLVGIVLLLLAATAVLGELQDALNQIWRVEPKTRSAFFQLLRTRLLSVSLIAGFGFLLLVSLVLNAAVTALGDFLDGILPGLELLIQLLNLTLSFAVTVALFAMIFKILPDVEVDWSDVWIGAGITALLFNVGKLLIGFYIGSSGVGSSYGAAGSFIVVLIWVYYSSQILLLGAEFTKAYAERYGSRRGRPAA